MSNSTHPWPTIPLGELVAEMCLGKMLDKQKNRGTLQPYLRNVNVRWFSFDLTDLKDMRFEDGEETRFELQAGDLVICEGGEPGRAAVWREQTENAKIQKALHRVRFRPDEYDPSFAMYYLFFGTGTNRFVRHYTGTTIKHLTGAALSQVHFPVPPLPEQRRIVAKIEELFSDLDAGVAALQRAKAKLKRYRAAVLKAAVEGSLTEQWRSEHPPKETAAELLKRILTERRRKWEQEQLAAYETAGKKSPANWKEKYKVPVGPDESTLPALPEGWCWATVEQLLARSEYGTSVKCAYEATGTPVLRIPNIAGGVISLSDMKYATHPLSLTEDDSLQCGDLLMCRTNGSISLIGKAALVKNKLVQAHSFASYLLRFRFVLTETLPAWVHLYVSSCGGRGFIESHAASSAGQHNISLSLMHGMPIPVAPLSEQERILCCVEDRMSAAERTSAQIAANLRRSTRLRQSILKRAFEGNLVPQDPKDEPASVLLERIKREKTVNNGKKAARKT